ncbi:hypothetical protein L596_030751 [Steinernema carpocapsae]|uniref:Secreted protein n=1 Tax=Steinernema carpocapsae TaxID=34508 RepID=A0A4U5LNN0_STECR|nr:hypothetical protein L596_030751 [Steinernema carpocapsae]
MHSHLTFFAHFLIRLHSPFIEVLNYVIRDSKPHGPRRLCRLALRRAPPESAEGAAHTSLRDDCVVVVVGFAASF